MNADNLRTLYDYHFTLNCKVWDQCVEELAEEQFKKKLGYSTGSIRNQAVHLLNIDDGWFSGLRGREISGLINPVHLSTRERIRAKWDEVELGIEDRGSGTNH